MNKIFNEDCLQTMSRLETESVDMILTSPPYDNLRTYNGYSFEFEKIASEIFRILKTGGVCVWVVADSVKKGGETLTSFRQALYFQSLGFLVHDTMLFAKINPIPLNHRRYEQAFEYMFCLSKGTPKIFNPLKEACKEAGRINSYGYGRRRQYGKEHSWANRELQFRETAIDKIHPNIFYYTIGREVSGHPAPFPKKLAIDQIQTWTEECQLVYDPFMGSGTTALACLLTGRRYLGSEISAEYCAIAEKRIDGVLRFA